MSSDYDNWSRVFDKQVALVKKTNSAIVAEAAEILKARIEKRTPIGKPELWKHPAPPGYTPGTLRASWVLDKSITDGGVYITISNDQPYAQRIEEGWSTQSPPQAMMRLSNLEWSNIVDKVAAKRKV